MTFGAAFLAVPELRPARIAGAPWGSGSLGLQLPGRPVAVGGLAPDQEAWIRTRFGPLVGEAPAEAVPLTVFAADESDFRTLSLKGREYSFELEPGPRALTLAGPRFVARVELAPTVRAGLWVGPSPEGFEFPSALDNLLRVLLAHTVSLGGGVVVHAAGIVAPDGAWLFLGPSGMGKSTLSRAALAAGREVLSDDLNAVVPTEGGPAVEKVPFAGDLGQADPRPRRAMLAGWAQLARGDRLAAQRLSPAVGRAVVVAQAPYLNADPWREPSLEAALDVLVGDRPVVRVEVPLGAPFDEVASVVRAAGVAVQ